MRGGPLPFPAPAVTATILLVPAVLLFGDDSGRGASAATEPLPGVPLPPAAGKTKLGPERVPLTRGEPLGPAGAPAPGQSRGGVPCGSKEQLRYHVHARLTIYIKGKPRKVPYGIGIGTPRRVNCTDRGPFVASGNASR